MLPSDRGGIPSDQSPYRRKPAAQTGPERYAATKARTRRSEWEATPAGQARTQNAQDLLGTKAPLALIYAEMGWNKQTGIGPKHYDVQLPGMGDPMSAPRPARWEELPKETRMHAERQMSQYGTSIDQMTNDFGAQVDQAHYRAARNGADLPYATDFYSSGEPAQVVKDSAKELGIPVQVHVLMNALTSPNTKFSQDTSEGRKYPNNEAAVHVVKHVQSGGTPGYVPQTEHDPETGEILRKHQGYGTNLAKAGRAYSQWESGGKTPSEWRNKPSKANPDGSGMIGPKTGPYANSFSDSHPQFFVSDVHSGGGGMLPHLSSDKPLVASEGGVEKRAKSEREVGISRIRHFHAAADYAARQAMQARGLGSVRDTQAAQWGEEQIQRQLKGGPTEDSAYQRTRQEIPGQGSLFPEMHIPKPSKKVDPNQGELFG